MGDTRSLAAKPKPIRAAPKVAPKRVQRTTTLPHAMAPIGLAHVQRALKVGAAHDPLEREAELTAARVVAMPAPSLAGQPPAEAPPAARRASTDDQPSTDVFEQVPQVPADHEDPQVPKGEDVDTAGVDADSFGEIERGAPDPEPDTLAPARDATAAVGPEGGAAPADVARAVAQPGAGRPLPRGLRSWMEPRFGLGFGDVRIHDRPEDRRVAARIGARAFTHRAHVWMGEGESLDDRRLMAHELTHVAQQTRRPAASSSANDACPARDAAEPPVRRGWLADKAESVARNVPGYTLLSVILGRSPITGDRVPRTAENLIGGFLGLIPGGDLIFRRLQETRALQNAFDWVSQRLGELNITWGRIKRLVGDFIDEMPAWSPLKVAKRIFGPVVRDIVTFVKDIVQKVLEFILRGALKLAGPLGDKIWGVIEKAGQVIGTILKDPLGFAKNLVRSVVTGFRQFTTNVGEHLKKGLMGWLFGSLQNAGIEMPAKLDFKGMISIGLQIVGLTYARFRAMLVKALGRKGEQKVSFIEKSVEAVKLLVKEGFLGLWQRFLQMIDGFKTTVIDGIRNFVIETLVKGALSWVAGLSNPVGAIVKVALAIYNMIKAFIERLDQIRELAMSIFNSIANIAAGKIKDAANFVEQAIARTIPVVLAFIAAVIPINGITRAIKNIIKKLQKPIANALKKLVRFVVKKAKKLFSKLLGKINRKRKLPGVPFKIGKAKHAFQPKTQGNKVGLMIASKPMRSDAVQQQLKVEATRAAELGDDSKCMDLFEQAFETEIDEAEAANAKVKPNQKKTPTKKTADKAKAETLDAAKKLDKLGACVESNLFIDTAPDDDTIIRAREPRLPEVEGFAGSHQARSQATKKRIEQAVTEASLGPRGAQKISNFYENDHVPEKSLGKAVKTFISTDAFYEGVEARDKKEQKAAGKILGDLDTMKIDNKGKLLPAITVYRPIHRQKTSKSAGGRDHQAIIEAAKAETTPSRRIAVLKSRIGAEMKAEIDDLTERYNADKAATKLIRGQLEAGFKTLGSESERIFGTKPGDTKPVDLKGGGDAAGSELPLGGNAAAKVPDFAEHEGERVAYKAKPEGFGNYLEYDHVVEATLAEKAAKLKVGDKALRSAVQKGTSDKIKALDLGEDEAKARHASARARLNKVFRRKVFAGTEVSGYDRDAAGTVGLYRPVHREVTAKQGSVRGSVLKSAALTEAIDKLSTFAAEEAEDEQLYEQGRQALRDAVRTRFEYELDDHVDLIKGAYKIEMKEFLAINRSKAAAGQMTGIVNRVGSSLRQLRQSSLSLLQ